MSFFKDLKEDIVQSVNELSDSLEEKVIEPEAKKEDGETLEHEVQKEIDSILEDDELLNDMQTEEEETAVTEEKDEEFSEPVDEAEETEEEILEAESDAEEEVLEEAVGKMTDVYEEVMAEKDNTTYVQEEKTVNEFEETEFGNSDETTVITKGTTINGGIKSDTSLVVKGVIEGDVECQGKLTIMGRVAGNSTAAEIYVNTPRLEGNLSSHGSVKIDVGTVVIGSISSASVVVAGAVKGDIDVNGPVIIDSTAVVKGAIMAKSIQVNSGAVIDGSCSLKYADVDLESFFE